MLIAIPILIQVYFNSGLAYGLMKLFRVPYAVAAPGALIGASNFFELAVATAIALYGPGSGAALATVVGVLVEVPVMLSVCRFCVGTRGWFEPPAAPAADVARIVVTATTPVETAQARGAPAMGVLASRRSRLLAFAAWWLVYSRLDGSGRVADAAALSAFRRGPRSAPPSSSLLYETPKVLMLLTLVVFGVGIVRSFFTAESARAGPSRGSARRPAASSPRCSAS